MALVKTINIASFQIGYLFYPFFKTIDPDNVFVVLIIHHITQAVISFLIIFIFSRVCKMSIKEFGFSFNKFRSSMKYVLIFVGIWSVIRQE
jgi:hypothetical protein